VVQNPQLQAPAEVKYKNGKPFVKDAKTGWWQPGDTVHYVVNGESYHIPKSKTIEFLKKFPRAQRASETTPSIRES